MPKWGSCRLLFEAALPSSSCRTVSGIPAAHGLYFQPGVPHLRRFSSTWKSRRVSGRLVTPASFSCCAIKRQDYRRGRYSRRPVIDEIPLASLNHADRQSTCLVHLIKWRRTLMPTVRATGSDSARFHANQHAPRRVFTNTPGDIRPLKFLAQQPEGCVCQWISGG
jgi:hypothetical protein